MKKYLQFKNESQIVGDMVDEVEDILLDIIDTHKTSYERYSNDNYIGLYIYLDHLDKNNLDSLFMYSEKLYKAMQSIKIAFERIKKIKQDIFFSISLNTDIHSRNYIFLNIDLN
jgi:hypothetical protein